MYVKELSYALQLDRLDPLEGAIEDTVGFTPPDFLNGKVGFVSHL